jgi:hypothetical protein
VLTSNLAVHRIHNFRSQAQTGESQPDSINLIGDGEQHVRHRATESPRRLRVDDELASPASREGFSPLRLRGAGHAECAMSGFLSAHGRIASNAAAARKISVSCNAREMS